MTITNQKIMKTMEEGFNRIDKQMNEGFKIVDQRFKAIDERFNHLERKVDEGFEKVNEKLSSVIVEVTSHGRTLEKLVTRDEFNMFKDQCLTNLDGLGDQIVLIKEDQILQQA